MIVTNANYRRSLPQGPPLIDPGAGVASRGIGIAKARPVLSEDDTGDLRTGGERRAA